MTDNFTPPTFSSTAPTPKTLSFALTQLCVMFLLFARVIILSYIILAALPALHCRAQLRNRNRRRAKEGVGLDVMSLSSQKNIWAICPTAFNCYCLPTKQNKSPSHNDYYCTPFVGEEMKNTIHLRTTPIPPPLTFKQKACHDAPRPKKQGMMNTISCLCAVILQLLSCDHH